MQLAQRWAVPHVTMFHTLARLKQLANPKEKEPALRLEMEQQLIKQADRIIAATADERMQLIRYCGATSSQVEVIPCGVDLRLFVPQNKLEARNTLGLPPSQPVLLFVGRLDPFKGPDLLLRAAAMMEEEAQVVIVGGKLEGDNELEQLKSLSFDLDISERVHFLGARPQRELPAVYNAADVTVMPSYHESFGLVAVESLACGTPVVATRAGGLTSVVRQDESGFLVPRCPGFLAGRASRTRSIPSMTSLLPRRAAWLRNKHKYILTCREGPQDARPFSRPQRARLGPYPLLTFGREKRGTGNRFRGLDLFILRFFPAEGRARRQ